MRIISVMNPNRALFDNVLLGKIPEFCGMSDERIMESGFHSNLRHRNKDGQYIFVL